MSDINISPINCAVWYGCHALAGRDGCVTPEACIRLNECAIRRCIAVGSCLADYSDYASLYRDTGCSDCIVKHGKIVNVGCADARIAPLVSVLTDVSIGHPVLVITMVATEWLVTGGGVIPNG